MLSKMGGGEQLAIYSAWLKALDKPDEGIKALEKMLEQAGGTPTEATAEAADVLAMLYMARGEQEKAKKAIDFGLKTLQYRGVKGGYVLALLRGRLKSDIAAGEAKRLYNQAEKLRAAKKFVEAGQLFAQVRAMYSTNQWGHASGFRIGQCYVGLNRPAQAIDWWQKFLKESPAGPWRGQAHVALVDATLEQLDLKKATEHVMAATAALDRVAGGLARRDDATQKDSDTSWREAAYDIHLRQGVVSLVDGRFDAAVQGFQQAKQSVPKGTSHEVQAGLDRLNEAAQQRAKLVPDELTVGDDRATTALALGNIYNVLRQYDMAKAFFSLPLSGLMRSHSAGHRSFAGLGLARILVATAGKEHNSKSPKPSPLAQAATAYEASLKEYPKGSWHDETLRELALLIERAAAEQCAPPPAAKAADKKGAEKPAAPISDATRQQQRKALVAARAAALPYWTDLPKRYPASRHVPQALYHTGVLDTDTEKPDEALAAFEELAKKYTDSPWTGDAHVRLIDVKLEHQFDLPGARNHAEAAVSWYENRVVGGQRSGASGKQSPNPQSLPSLFPDDTLPSLRQTGYDIYIRAGLVEYLLEHPERAVGFFEKAKPLQPERNFVVVHGTIPTGIERLIAAAKSGKSLTPEIVRKGDEKAKLILMLADVYHEGQQHEKSLDLCTRVVAGSAPKATREQKSYAHFRRARNHYLIAGSAFDPDASLTDYVAAVKTAPRAPWADKAMFLAGNVEWNNKHDLEAAVAIWRRLLKDYPKSNEADRCALFIGTAFFFSKKYPEAQRALEQFVADYPNSRFVADAKKLLDRCKAPLDSSEKGAEK